MRPARILPGGRGAVSHEPAAADFHPGAAANRVMSDARLSEAYALHKAGRFAEAGHNRAVARIVVADYRGAEADLDRALLLRHDYAEALEHRGLALALQGRHGEALTDYDAALKLQPSNIALLCRRADVHLRLN